VGIERRGLEFFMAEQDLDGADIFALLEQMRGERVTLIPPAELAS
jgi:hypothetical protein